jgi:RimJ/RimL family protein N-acetyltransferase
MTTPLHLGRFEVHGPRDHAQMRGYPAAYTWVVAQADSPQHLIERVTQAMASSGLRVVSSEQVALLDAQQPQPEEISQLMRDALRQPEFVHHSRMQPFEDTGTRRPTLLEVKTPRLLLRPWHRSDRDAFAAMNADPLGMHFAPRVLTRRESDQLMDAYLTEFHHNGFSCLVAELRPVDGKRSSKPRPEAFAGVMGLRIMQDILPGLPQPSVELTVRLKREHQRQGLATEGGLALLKLAFDDFQLHEVVAVAPVADKAGRALLKKIGMRPRATQEFDHARYPPHHLYARHMIYSVLSPHTTTTH